MNSANKLLSIHEINLLNQKSVNRQSLFCEEIYTAQKKFPQLLSHDFIQVCFVVEGSGIHCVLD